MAKASSFNTIERENKPNFYNDYDRIIYHQTLGSEELGARAFPAALINLKTAFQLAHSAGNTLELPGIAYELGIAAMYVIQLVPSPAAASEQQAASGKPVLTVKTSPSKRTPLRPRPLSPTRSMTALDQRLTEMSSGSDEALGQRMHVPKSQSMPRLSINKFDRIVEEAITEAEAQGEAANDDADDALLSTSDVEKRRFAFRRFRSVSYSQFDKVKTSSSSSKSQPGPSASAPPATPATPQTSPTPSTATAVTTPPPKRSYFRSKSFGSSLRTKSTFPAPLPIATLREEQQGALPSPPVTPPLGTHQLTDPGIKTSDLNTAATAVSYLLRLVTTKQTLQNLQIKTPTPADLPFEEEDERLWSGEMTMSEEDLVVGTQIHKSQVLYKKAELCYMISCIYSWVGQTFLAEQHMKQARDFAADYRLILNLPIDADVFPVFSVEDQEPLAAIKPKAPEGLFSKLSRRFSKISVS